MMILRTERQKLQSSLDQAIADCKELRVQVRSLDDAITQLENKGSDVASVAATPQKTLRELILDVLSNTHQGMTPAEIAKTISDGGRETGNTTVSSLLSRFKKNGWVWKRSGKWYVKRNENEEGPDEKPPEPPESNDVEDTTSYQSSTSDGRVLS